jgi:hypothetical protein
MLYRLFSWLFRVVGRQYKDPRNQQRIEHCDVARRTTTVKSSDIHAASTQLRSVQTDLADAYTLCFSRPNAQAYEYVVLGLPDPRQSPRLINQGIDEDTRIILTMVKES